MNKTTLAWALVPTYFILATAIPVLDYRGSGFFTVLALFMLSPVVLISIALCVAFFYTTVGAVVKLRQRDIASLRLLALSTTFLACNALLIWYVTVSLISPSPPHWFAHGAFYHTIANALSIVLVVVAVALLLGVPIVALILALAHLSRKQWSGLKYVAVVAVGFGCYSAGSRTNDLLTVASCSQGMQSALEAARNGKTLPAMSQSFRFGVLGRNQQVAVCMLNGPLFDAQYVAYDPTDSSPALASQRVGMLLGRGQCRVKATRIKSRYYWISEAC